ncbi:MAG: hypothetical protein H6942_00455 [Candidatus Accumulibacter sp.]|uniref:hypothetical protein n=1 Tax=Accumulibacter sp. TaxID=2053492 RepID=UPI0019FF9432|nr:hypothetical protein [Accumulibacter sp.]MBE2258612.1 hypothetical protein [Paracoccaceae bacterium]MCB1941905.1 hypothetical protein [Accumulibacter sp.]MCP5247012.1 hypothetical protein [Accumulibacter sp.]
MHQLDIFLDSREVTLANEVIAALLARDSESAAHGIARLRAEAPERSDLPCFDRLNDFLQLFQHADFSLLDADAIEVAVDVLATRIVPCARVLGRAGKDFLGFFWRRLAQAAGAPFDPERPQLHAAELYLRAEAYDRVEEAASAVAGHSRHPAVLRWRAISCHRRSGLRATRLPIFLFAWHAPASFVDLLGELDDSRLEKEWVAFQAEAEDLDASWFPAWLLLRHPAVLLDLHVSLAGRFDEHATAAEIPAMQACLLLVGILDLEKSGHSRRLVEQRAHLRAIDQGFFALYMQSRDVCYR